MVLPYQVKQKFYGGGKLLAVRSYHIYSKSLTCLYMKFMQKSPSGGQGKIGRIVITIRVLKRESKQIDKLLL